MVPPLSNPIARVYWHPSYNFPDDPQLDAHLTGKAAVLRDVELALGGKPVGPGGSKRMLYECKDSSARWGALRLYYTVVVDSVVVLRWGGKGRQEQDIELSVKMAQTVRASPASFQIPSHQVA